MGDSITFGQHLDPAWRWTSLIAARLTRMYLHTSVNVLSLNKGVSGETTRQALERYPQDVQTFYPDLMTLQFGLNDCNCWLTDQGAPRVSPAGFRANLIEMVDRARRFGASQIILANNHPTLRRKIMLSGEAYEEANRRYSEISREVASSTRVTFCDIRAAFDGYSLEELEQFLLP